MNLHVQLPVRRPDFTMDIDLTLPARGVLALTGPSGCGKTTILRSLAGLERYAGATLRLGDVVLQDDSRFVPPHRRAIGYVFQESMLLPHLSVHDNLRYGWKRVAPRSHTVSLDDAIAWLGIAPLLERRPATLSGGERQRVAIARALATSPRLLLLDEPLASLDADRKRDIVPYIDTLCAHLDIPVIYVSHSAEEVSRLADQLVLMEPGRVVAAGPIQELMTRLDLPLALAADAAALVEARVVGHDTANHLTRLDSAAGRFFVVHRELEPGSHARLRIAARDVSLTLAEPRDTSILNHFPATVDALAATGTALVTVGLRVGDVPLLARITQRSAGELGLEPGRRVYAQVKSVALLD